MRRALAAVALGALLCLTAAGFDVPSLYVPGVAIALLAIVGSVWVLLAATGARLVREPGPRAVEEEQPYPVRISARTGLARAPGGELREPLLEETIGMVWRRDRRLRIDVRFGRRGRRELGPAELVLRDPLGLFDRRLEAGAGQEVLVLPRIERVRSTGGGDGRFSGAASAARLAAAAESEIDGLRPHQEGAPAARIHWPAVARTGEMIERKLVPESDDRPLVVLDAHDPAGERELDMAVRAAASLTVHLAGIGGCALMLPDERRPVEVEGDMRAWHALHARLAVLEAANRPPVLPRGRRRALFWVTASPAARRPAALDRAAAESRWLVVPGTLAGRAAGFHVAGCHGYELGRAARRAA